MKYEHWIVGLMRENYEAVGFIPATTVEDRYIAHNQAIVQSSESGRPVGYLLHGAMCYGRSVSIAQHCIQIDSRLRGYGDQALRVLRDRANRIGAAGISVRCASDLESLHF